MTDAPLPRGLNRPHTWVPHQHAVDAAVAVPRYMDADDYLDRYLIRIKSMGKQPTSGEFLSWFLDDDAKAKREERIAAQRGTSGSGVPGWAE